MLSICIPIYNFDVNPLVLALTKQIEDLDSPAEIVLIDDASDKEYRELNYPSCSKHKYYLLDKNIGRSRIRNLFLNYAIHDYLLFLDCDVEIVNDDFLKNYQSAINNFHYDVVCGGRVYPKTCNDKRKQLSWFYGIKRESKTSLERMMNPNNSFMSNNFVISRSLFVNQGFDESIVGYGHEDTLFGYRLSQLNIPISHIENYVMNGDIVDNSIFLNKTKIGVENLLFIWRKEPGLLSSITLLKTYDWLKRKKLIWPYYLAFSIMKPLFVRLLASGLKSMILFDLYKLGLFIHVSKKNDSDGINLFQVLSNLPETVS